MKKGTSLFPELVNKNWLIKQYIELGYTQKAIAKTVGCTKETVQRWIKRHGIVVSDLREKIGVALTKFPILRNRSWLVHQYHTLEHTQQEIANQVGCTQLRVQWWVKRRKIPISDWAHREARSERISKKLKGNKNGLGRVVSQDLKDRFSRERRGKNNPFYGHKRTQEWYEKLIPIWKDRRGPKNPNWKDGASKNPYPVEFNKQLKELIRQRDGHRCQKCGMPECENGKRLTVHHIDYDKENCLPSNLISLCCSCSSKVNGNRGYWEAYFKDKIHLQVCLN